MSSPSSHRPLSRAAKRKIQPDEPAPRAESIRVVTKEGNQAEFTQFWKVPEFLQSYGGTASFSKFSEAFGVDLGDARNKAFRDVFEKHDSYDITFKDSEWFLSLVPALGVRDIGGLLHLFHNEIPSGCHTLPGVTGCVFGVPESTVGQMYDGAIADVDEMIASGAVDWVSSTANGSRCVAGNRVFFPGTRGLAAPPEVRRLWQQVKVPSPPEVRKCLVERGLRSAKFYSDQDAAEARRRKQEQDLKDERVAQLKEERKLAAKAQREKQRLIQEEQDRAEEDRAREDELRRNFSQTSEEARRTNLSNILG